mmetsp:Transcript_115079/g.229173  ORF Transcript_115079/g.229173 Transcript_115079/m.229173 type:complete len:195 (-) Transcript_115079:22-606(-)
MAGTHSMCVKHMLPTVASSFSGLGTGASSAMQVKAKSDGPSSSITISAGVVAGGTVHPVRHDRRCPDVPVQDCAIVVGPLRPNAFRDAGAKAGICCNAGLRPSATTAWECICSNSRSAWRPTASTLTMVGHPRMPTCRGAREYNSDVCFEKPTVILYQHKDAALERRRQARHVYHGGREREQSRLSCVWMKSLC